LIANGGGGVLAHHFEGSLENAINTLFTESEDQKELHNKDKYNLLNISKSREKFIPLISKRQLHLSQLVRKLFVDEEVHCNFNLDVQMWTNNSIELENSLIELDIFIPSLMLAFEYQGEQHYHSRGQFEAVSIQQERDLKKKSICKRLKITLIDIPYWWDSRMGSLEEIVVQERPDLRNKMNKRSCDLNSISI